MRINKWLAQATGLSRRAADREIEAGTVTINNQPAALGSHVKTTDQVFLRGKLVSPFEKTTLIFHKPAGYVCSRRGQGSRTIYELLPPEFAKLKSVGRLDKDSSGLLLLSSDGDLAEQLTHPRYAKTKVYEVMLDQPLTANYRQQISGQGIDLEDGPSRLSLAPISTDMRRWRVTMSEGRNRQIRRTFAALGYRVIVLHRTQFGPYRLDNLTPGQFRRLPD